MELPLELDREILELAAVEVPTRIPMFMTINRQAKAWLEPMLYESIILEVENNHLSGPLTARSSGCLAATKRASPSFIQRDTKRLLLDGRLHPDIVLQALSLCTGVKKVGTYVSSLRSCPEQSHLLATLPNLRELSCPLGLLADLALHRSLREGISRLELEWSGWLRCRASRDPSEVDALVPLQQFRRLTHLCLRPPAYQQEDWLLGSPKLAWLVRTCPDIQVLVIAPDYGESKKKLSLQTRVVEAHKQHGIGVVVIGESYCWKNDWEGNALSMWEFAEASLSRSLDHP